MNSESTKEEMDDESVLGTSDKQTTCKRIVDLTIDCDRESDSPSYNLARVNSSSNGSENTAALAGLEKDGGNDMETKLQTAKRLVMQGRREEALLILDRILSRDPNHVDALCCQGKCLSELGQKAHALAAFAGALSVDPTHTDSLIYCGILNKDIGNTERAMEMIRKAYDSIEEGEQEVKGNAGSTLATVLTDIATEKKLQGGPGWKEMYLEAIQICPSHAPSHYNLGVAAAECGEDDEALQHFTKAVALHPSYVEALCNMGVIMQKKVGQHCCFCYAIVQAICMFSWACFVVDLTQLTLECEFCVGKASRCHCDV